MGIWKLFADLPQEVEEICREENQGFHALITT